MRVCWFETDTRNVGEMYEAQAAVQADNGLQPED